MYTKITLSFLFLIVALNVSFGLASTRDVIKNGADLSRVTRDLEDKPCGPAEARSSINCTNYSSNETIAATNNATEIFKNTSTIFVANTTETTENNGSANGAIGTGPSPTARPTQKPSRQPVEPSTKQPAMDPSLEQPTGGSTQNPSESPTVSNGASMASSKAVFTGLLSVAMAVAIV